jgi:predicted transcriptional regulator
MIIKNIKDIVYVPDYMAVLSIFSENRNLSVTELHYKSQISYSILHDMKKVFVERGWVTIQHIDKKHIVMITSKGEELVQIIYSLLDKLGIDKDEFLKLRLHRKRKGVKPNDKEESSIRDEEGQQNQIGEGEQEKTVSGGLLTTEEGIITGEG